MALDVELAEIRDFLARTAPFSDLSRDVLERLPAQLSVTYFRRGTPLITRGRTNDTLFIIRSGAIEIVDDTGTLVERGGDGTIAGAISLASGEPSDFDVTAIEDTLVLVVPQLVFERLRSESAEFAQFFEIQKSARMRGAVAALHASDDGSAVLKTTVRDLVRRDMVTGHPDQSIAEAAQIMDRERVSALPIINTDGELVGIVTDRDLRSRVVAAGRDPQDSVESVMTVSPITGSADALAFEVLLEMVSRNIHHLPILERGRAIGMVTATDLMRLQQANPVYLVGDVAKQRDVAGIASVASRLPQVVESLVRQDASADDIGRVVTTIGDAIERQLITLAEAELGPPPTAYCWVTLGSRARFEQALGADQDHALILSDEASEADEAYFAALANFVSQGLLAAGYPHCDGDVMATNPAWRQRLSQWRRQMTEWIDTPTSEAVLRASVFFDMRPIAGDTALFEHLQTHWLSRTQTSPRFLMHLASAATQNEPPLGFFRGFVLAKSGQHKDTLDIKRGGVQAVVELARVHALAHGINAVNTQTRLAAAASAGAMAPRRAHDLKDAFEFIAYVRLRHQARAMRAGLPPDNFVDPAELSDLDKRHLREAFEIVRDAQKVLEKIYGSGLL